MDFFVCYMCKRLYSGDGQLDYDWCPDCQEELGQFVNEIAAEKTRNELSKIFYEPSKD